MATQNSLNNTSGGFTISTFAAAGVVTNNASGVLATAAGTNGQALIGSTGAAPVFATLTSSDSSVTFTTGAGTLSLQVANPVMSYVSVTGTTQSMAVNTIYAANNAALVTMTLPTTAAVGTRISVIGGASGLSSGSWKIAQNASQLINFGNQVTTTGTGGSLQATNQFDSIQLICIVANTTWTVLGGSQGNITVV
jgi:hypothetical protein